MKPTPAQEIKEDMRNIFLHVDGIILFIVCKCSGPPLGNCGVVIPVPLHLSGLTGQLFNDDI